LRSAGDVDGVHRDRAQRDDDSPFARLVVLGEVLPVLEHLALVGRELRVGAVARVAKPWPSSRSRYEAGKSVIVSILSRG